MFTEDELADAGALLSAIQRRLDGLAILEADGDLYVYYDPGDRTPPDKRFPFCTLMTGDRYDGASNLDRDGSTYRINVGAGRAGYESRFGPAPRQAVGMAVIDTGFDYTATDTVLPHPFYAPMHWVCVVNPAARTGAVVSELLGDAHARAKRAFDNRDNRAGRDGG